MAAIFYLGLNVLELKFYTTTVDIACVVIKPSKENDPA